MTNQQAIGHIQSRLYVPNNNTITVDKQHVHYILNNDNQLIMYVHDSFPLQQDSPSALWLGDVCIVACSALDVVVAVVAVAVRPSSFAAAAVHTSSSWS